MRAKLQSNTRVPVAPSRVRDADSPFACSRKEMALVVDCKEHGLIRALRRQSLPHEVKSLAVGDVLCTYDNPGGSAWVMERKRADDFAASIKDGRWREQTAR